MGWLDYDDVGNWENSVKHAQRDVEIAKANKEEAKRSNNYRTAIKNIALPDGRSVNCYDYNIWQAQNKVKYAKENLAKAKAAKREKAARERENAARERERRKEERVCNQSKSETSSNSYSSSSTRQEYTQPKPETSSRFYSSSSTRHDSAHDFDDEFDDRTSKEEQSNSTSSDNKITKFEWIIMSIGGILVIVMIYYIIKFFCWLYEYISDYVSTLLSY